MGDKRIQTRRRFIEQSTVASAALLGGTPHLASRRAAAQVVGDAARPLAPWGMQIGDVQGDRAIVWSRSDVAARLMVQWSRYEDFRDPYVVRGPYALEATDNTARVDLTGLPLGEQIFVRVYFEGLDSTHASSQPLFGQFNTSPGRRRNIRFLWSGDTCGQGWGIDLGFGGMRIYESMRLQEPDFFIHSGDNIYADGPLQPQVFDASGDLVWENAFLDEVPEKLKVAESLHEFRRNYLYNRYDENVRRFSAAVPQVWQWDDHEVVNNWSASKVLDTRYDPATTVQGLAANATRAFMDYSPMRWHSHVEEERVYRKIPYGDDLDVFVIDMRSYRAANSCNLQQEPGADTALLGAVQIAWLQQGLRESTATWKVIASDMPIGLVVGDGTDPETGCPRGENAANGDGPVLGREFELAEILRFIKRADIENVVWLTADVHYCAAHYYDPEVAVFRDFKPFWEFVSGPLHAGSFGPNALDNTFGPSVVFQQAPPSANLPPSWGLQFFGQVDIDARTKHMLVTLKDIDGVEVFSQRLLPERRRRRSGG